MPARRYLRTTPNNDCLGLFSFGWAPTRVLTCSNLSAECRSPVRRTYVQCVGRLAFIFSDRHRSSGAYAMVACSNPIRSDRRGHSDAKHVLVECGACPLQFAARSPDDSA